jgi:hypothetical protein
MKSKSLLLALIFSIAFLANSEAQRKRKTESSSTVSFDESLYQDMHWRNIGPFRGGRSTTATGVTSQPLTYYFGSTGGGVWKTTNAGNTWTNVSDGFFNSGSLGAIAVSESDPNVVYAGMGEGHQVEMECIKAQMQEKPGSTLALNPHFILAKFKFILMIPMWSL